MIRFRSNTTRSRTTRFLTAAVLTVGLAGSSTAAGAIRLADDPAPADVEADSGDVKPVTPGGFTLLLPGDDLCDSKPGICDLVNPDDEPECDPMLGSCDLKNPPPDDDDCDPMMGSCDLANPTGPTHPTDPEDPEVDDSDVDAPVKANPTFTG